MPTAMILGTGRYIPDKLVTNDDLAKLMDTNDAWIQQRTGIQERHYVDFDKEPMGASELGARAAKAALENAGVGPDEIDLIVYATLSSDKIFPGDGVLVQAKLDIPAGVPALDVRNQCSGFLYGLSIANAFIQNKTYQKILLIGSEVHSTGLDFTDKGRDIAVLFGDGAGAMVLGPNTKEPNRGILSVHLHADGRFAEELHVSYPSSAEMPRTSIERLQSGKDHYPQMNGRNVFKHAVVRMPEAVKEALAANQYTLPDLRLVIPHQANLRITEMVQRRLELRDDQVFSNIQKYGNTTAGSLPIAFDEVARDNIIKRGDLICLTAFGAGFTWASALLKY